MNSSGNEKNPGRVSEQSPLGVFEPGSTPHDRSPRASNVKKKEENVKKNEQTPGGASASAGIGQ